MKNKLVTERLPILQEIYFVQVSKVQMAQNPKDGKKDIDYKQHTGVPSSSQTSDDKAKMQVLLVFEVFWLNSGVLKAFSPKTNFRQNSHFGQKQK